MRLLNEGRRVVDRPESVRILQQNTAQILVSQVHLFSLDNNCLDPVTTEEKQTSAQT